MIHILIILILALSPVLGDVKSTTSQINFDALNDGQVEMILNQTGLGIGVTPTANLHVSGNTIITTQLHIGNNTGTSNLNLSGTIGYGFQTFNTDTLLSDSSIVFADSSSDNLVLTLPYAGNVIGREYQIKKVSSNNNVIIQGGGAIDDDYQIILSEGEHGYATLMSRGTQYWSILGLSGNGSPTEYEYTTSTGSNGISGFAHNNGSTFSTSSITVKNAGAGSTFTRKGYIRIDVSDLNVSPTNAELQLTLSTNDGANSHTIYVYGLQDESLDFWDETTMTYNTAPANDLSSGQAPDTASGNAIFLDSFTIGSSESSGTIKSISGTALANFIDSDTNGVITLILGRSSNNSNENITFQTSGGVPKIIITP